MDRQSRMDFYDLVTNGRYGIGSVMGRFGCDRFALYAIAGIAMKWFRMGLAAKSHDLLSMPILPHSGKRKTLLMIWHPYFAECLYGMECS